MCNHSEEFPFYHGWDHLWFDPKNVTLKEIVKGPFLNPKLLLPIPYVTLRQQDGDSIRLHNGIPNCWAEYLLHNSIFPRNHLGNYELMQKEDVEIVPQLRKNYRLYIGQGIPDPWLSHPNFENTEIIPRRNSKDLKFLHFPKNRKSNCYCCEKKYLFECPDKNSIKDCPCKNCHGSSPDCGENCECISLLRDWVLKNTHGKRGKKPRRRKSSVRSSSNESRTEDEEPKYCVLPSCECLRHYNDNGETTSSETEEEYNEKPHNNRQKNLKNQSRLCCYPYVHNFYLRNFSYHERNCPECRKTNSKQIQTESLPSKDSKIVQTDNLKTNLTRVCNNSSKCSRCGLFRCKMPWTKLAYPAMHSVPSLCFTPNVFHNSAIICPYSFPNHFVFPKPPKHDECKKLNKKQQKNRVCEDESDIELRDNRRRNKADEENTKKSENKNPTGDLNNDDVNNNKNIYCCQSSSKGLEHFKYLTDERLKAYIQREDKFLEKSTPLASKFKNFCRGDRSVTNSIPERYKYDRFKAFSRYKSKLSDSFEDCKKMYLRNGRHPTKLLSSSDQATMTAFEEAEKSEKGFSKLKYLKSMVESDESKTCAQGRNSDDPHRANRRRRRLLTNRKRRRKLAASSRATILEYQALLDKMSKSPQLVSKHVQAEGTYQDRHFARTLSENDSLPLGITNFYENPNLRFKDVSFNSNPVRTDILRKPEGIGRINSGEYSKHGTLGESLRPSLRVDMKFNKVLEKISSPNKGVWTSSALKNIVDDLLTENKPEQVNLRV